MKRLLAISWAMPPLVFPRSLQVSRTFKELARRGWSIDVVAAAPEAVPSATIDDGLRAAYDTHYALHPVDFRHQALPTVQRWWYDRRPPVEPDDFHWRRLARARAQRLLGKKRHDVMATFAQPWSDHLAGLEIKRRFPDLPWLAHFSDPWVDSPYLASIVTPERMEAWRKEEREVIEAADAIAFVTGRTADLVMAKYPPAWKEKAFVVPHGFDPDLRSRVAGAATRRNRIVHTGNLYGLRVPETFLRALASLRRSREIPLPELVFLGTAADTFHTLVEELDLVDMVRTMPPTGYFEALRAASEAGALLLIDAPLEDSMFLPSKLMDYMLLGLPIIGLTPERGESADALRAIGCPVLSGKDPGAMERSLSDLLRKFAAGGLTVPSSASLERYDIRTTTDPFESALHHAVRHAGQRHRKHP